MAPEGHAALSSYLSAQTSRFGALFLGLGERTAELRPRRDTELAVDTAEIGLDGLRADEHPCGDALVRQPIGGELRDLSFGRRQGCRRLSRRDALQFGSGALGPELGADILEDAECCRERLLRKSLPLRPSVDLPENEQRACAFEFEIAWRMPSFVRASPS